MSSYLQDIPQDEVLNLSSKDNSFKMAFSVESYIKPKVMKNSPEYVKWLFRLFKIKDGVSTHTEIDTHLCTEEDYAQFYPIQGSQVDLLDDIKNNPDRGFLCFDETGEGVPDFDIYGSETMDNYQRLEVIMMPCNSVMTEAGLMDGEKG